MIRNICFAIATILCLIANLVTARGEVHSDPLAIYNHLPGKVVFTEFKCGEAFFAG